MASVLLAFVLFVQQPSFRADVSLVRVDAQVTDHDRIIGDLEKEDFAVQDNGTGQPILYFAREEDPLDLLLLLDVSGSMKTQVRKMAGASRSALAELRTGDRVAIMVFTMSARLLAPLSDDLGAMERVLNEEALEKIRGGTNINGAVYEAAKVFLGQPRKGRRRVVLIVTDNISPKFKKDRTVVQALWEADAVLDALLCTSKLGTALKWNRRITFPPALWTEANVKKIAEQTGGDSLAAEDAGAAFRNAIDRLRRRYSLYYRAPEGKAGEVRKVAVSLSDPGKVKYPQAVVRARKGYILRASP